MLTLLGYSADDPRFGTGYAIAAYVEYIARAAED